MALHVGMVLESWLPNHHPHFFTWDLKSSVFSLQIMVNILAGKSQELNFVNNVFKWIGIVSILYPLNLVRSLFVDLFI